MGDKKMIIALVAMLTIGTALSAEFSPNFKFGSATAAYQIEGAWDADGKGPSIWDTFTHNYSHLIADGSSGDIAANSYELFREDIKALNYVGVDFYRLSVSWPRILPDGFPSSLNQAGIDYYNLLIDELLAAGIEPMVTMYHWDLPQALQDIGGLHNPEFQYWFRDYARVLYENFGDRITSWITFNEPSVYCNNGWGWGSWPPQVNSPGLGDYLCHHNTILASAQAWHLYHDEFISTQNGRVGITLNAGFSFVHDYGNNPADVEAADRGLQWGVGIDAHAIFSEVGGYPQVMIDRIAANSAAEGLSESRLPTLTPEQIEYIKGTSDFFGLNYYTSRYVMDATDGVGDAETSMWKDSAIWEYTLEHWPRAKSDWLFSAPEGLTALLQWIRDEYNNPEVIITENGWSENDDDEDDIERQAYLKAHLNAVLDAIDDGCNVTAHTTWSIIDNFEWLRGYTEKFGIFKVDFEDPDRPRTAKPSATLLKDIIATRIVPE